MKNSCLTLNKAQPVVNNPGSTHSLHESVSSTHTDQFDTSDIEVDFYLVLMYVMRRRITFMEFLIVTLQTNLDGHQLSAKEERKPLCLSMLYDGFLLIAEQNYNYKTSVLIQSPRAQTSLSLFLRMHL